LTQFASRGNRFKKKRATLPQQFATPSASAIKGDGKFSAISLKTPAKIGTVLDITKVIVAHWLRLNLAHDSAIRFD